MNYKRAILIGFGIWFLGVSAFGLSAFIPVMGDQVLQANLILALTLIPLVWYGTHIYLKKDRNVAALQLAVVMMLATISLDAVITVPVLVLPAGGSYREFFLEPGFWVIVLEYIIVSVSATIFYRRRNSQLS